MSKVYLNAQMTLAGLVVLGLSGCVYISNPDMPADWPTLVPLTESSAINGIYTGDKRELSIFGSIFFRSGELYYHMNSFRAEGFRITGNGNEVTVEALAGGVVFTVQRQLVRIEDGAIFFERKTSGHEGLAAASYHSEWRMQLNRAGDLVVRHHASSIGVVFPLPGGSSSTTWLRLHLAQRVH